MLNLYKQAILCMSHIPGIGSKRIQAIWNAFGEKWWECKVDDYRELTGIGKELAESIVKHRNKLDPIALESKLSRLEIRFHTSEECDFPVMLRMIPNPPLYVFTKGEVRACDQRAIAVVGTRKPTYYGIEAAKYIGEHAAGYGLTVISGMARGIDRYAHEGALATSGRTGAVLAHGLDQVYPREHHLLAEKICKHGFLLSEYPPGFPAKPQQFTYRNRIISGLSLCTIVVEAGFKSGALFTAEFALEQGRDVMAVPGSIFDAASVGTNTLLYEGATPLRSFQDVLEVVRCKFDHFAFDVPDLKATKEGELTVNKPNKMQLSKDDEDLNTIRNIVEKIPVTGVRVHDLVNCISNLTLSQLHVNLVKLEVKGWITRIGDTVYPNR